MRFLDELRSTGDTDATHADAARFLSTLLDRPVLGDGTRRALLRRLADATHANLPEPLRVSPHFALHVARAIDTHDTAWCAPLVDAYRATLARADALDLSAAIVLAQRLDKPTTVGDELTVPQSLVSAQTRREAWEALARAWGIRLSIFSPNVTEAALDRRSIAGACAFLRVAAGGDEAAIRTALASPLAPITPADARTLIVTAGAKHNVLSIIDAGSAGGGRTFAHAVRSLRQAYAPERSDAIAMIAALNATLEIPTQTAHVLTCIARDFERARTLLEPSLAPWNAEELIAAIEAECIDAPVLLPALEPQPLATQLPEAALPVTAKRATFSASSLNTFAECARKWYYRYACGAVEDPGSSASFYGTAFHAALEDFHTDHQRFDGTGYDLETLEATLDFRMVAAFDRHRNRFAAPVEFELLKRRARRTAKRYIRWLLERAQARPFEVVDCETQINMKLDGYQFNGFIDRLDRDLATGEITVIDYKTGSIAKTAGDYLAEVRAYEEFQLPFYYWACIEMGYDVKRLTLIPVKEPTLDVAPVELTVVSATPGRKPNRGAKTGTIGIDELKLARKKMVELAAKLATPTLAEYPVSSDPDACRYCSYKASCRQRPAAAEERFGR